MGYGLDEPWEYEPTEEEELELLFLNNQKIWNNNSAAKVGDKIKCPWCEKSMKKKSWQHKFCSTQCKDKHWNISPERLGRTLEWRSE